MTATARLPAPLRAPLGLKVNSSDRQGAAWGGKGAARLWGKPGIRYRALGVAQRLMFAPGLPAEHQAAICRCQWRRIGPTVRVRQHKLTGRTSYQGLMSCNNVWACPVCSNRITDGRRDELQRAVGLWKEQGGECYLLTGTFPHQRKDKLVDLIAMMRKAADTFNTSKATRRAREQAGYVGQIRALEVTWGSWHGWHPHFHFLYFCQPGQADTLRGLESTWAAALIKSGLADPSQLNDMLRGADGEAAAWDVQNGDYAADYIAKFGHEPSLNSKLEAGATWGIARELVKGMNKTGRRLRGLTPFTLLAAAAGSYALQGMDKGHAAALFCEFAAAFKGQRQLYWSPKLDQRLNVGRLFTDEELCDMADKKPEMETVCTICADDWALVLAHEQRDAVLRAAEESGAAGVRALLDRLRAAPPPRVSAALLTREDADGHVIGLDSPRWGHGL